MLDGWAPSLARECQVQFRAFAETVKERRLRIPDPKVVFGKRRDEAGGEILRVEHLEAVGAESKDRRNALTQPEGVLEADREDLAAKAARRLAEVALPVRGPTR